MIASSIVFNIQNIWNQNKSFFFYFVAMCKLYQIKSKTVRKSMWFWLVSRPTNCPVNFSFFFVGQKNWPVSETGHFFVHSFDFLSSLDIREWPIFKKDWTKNSREWTKKKLSGLWDRTFSFGWPKKMRNWQDNWLAKKTDQNHMNTPIVFAWLTCTHWLCFQASI